VTNPYEAAHKCQTEIDELNKMVADLNARVVTLKQQRDEYIQRGMSTGATQIGAYAVHKVMRRRTERKVDLTEIVTYAPEIVRQAGTLKSEFVCAHLSPRAQERMMADPQFEDNYSISLGDLDKATGGKKQSVPYVTETETIKEVVLVKRVVEDIVV